MSVEHRELAAGRWSRMSFVEQMANTGSEVERTMLWRQKGSPDYSMRAFCRALELLDLTMADRRNRGRLRELARLREALADYFCGDNRFASSDELWRGYFLAFARAARPGGPG